jgi:hypothetical protein
MFLKRGLAPFAAVIAAVAVGAPGPLSGAMSVSVANASIQSLSCPADYSGPTNPVTGCPYTAMR